VITGSTSRVLRALERARWDPLTDVAEVVVAWARPTTFRVLAWTVLIVLLAVAPLPAPVRHPGAAARGPARRPR
jgi:hypothetical protein